MCVTVVEGCGGGADKCPESPAPLASVAPGLSVLTVTVDGWLQKPDTLPWACLFLILPSPPLFLEEVRQIVLPVELAFSFSMGYL